MKATEREMKEEHKKRCGVCEIPYFERNNYFYGKMMTVRDFFAEQRYFNEKRWLINRMILGWGVVCGLEVRPKDNAVDEVVVTPGLAIDCCGREILVCCDQVVKLQPEVSECQEAKPAEGAEKKFYLCIEYHHCKTEQVLLPPLACDQREKGEFNRIRDSFIITVKTPDEIKPPKFCLERCPLIDDKQAPLHDYLCQKLKEGCPECPEKSCLILAEVTVTPSKDPSEPPSVTIDPCSKRRLVHGNQVLYDLIRCFHDNLPHVTKINWQGNGAIITFEDFITGIYDEGVKVWFDQEMDGKTINGNTFQVMVKMEDAETGNSRYVMIPGEVSYTYDESTKASVATFKINSKWVIDVYFGYSSVRDKGGEFLVVLKGDFIMTVGDDCNPARALDGNFIGGTPPSGNGSPGGDFISWFSVSPEPGQPGSEKGKRK
jgi:hypothetical protein